MEVVRTGAAGIHHEQDGAFQLSVILLPMFLSKVPLTQVSAFQGNLVSPSSHPWPLP